MKKLYTTLVIALLSMNVFGQDTIFSSSKSNIGKLYNSTNVALKKEFIKVGYIVNDPNNRAEIEVLN